MSIHRGLSLGLTLTSYFGLLGLLLSWPTLIAPPQRIPVALILIVTVIPLLFPLRGLLYGRRNSFIWTGYLSLFYFIHAVMEVWAVGIDGKNLAAGIELLASSLLFFGTVLYLKAPA